MKIGEVAKSVGISVQAVRFYEKRGLITPGKRSASGYRIYDDKSVGLLKFIKNSRDLGFSLNATATLVQLMETPNPERCGEIKEMFQGMLKKYQDDMAQLNSRYAELSAVVESCPGKAKGGKGHSHEDGECRMLQKLAKTMK